MKLGLFIWTIRDLFGVAVIAFFILAVTFMWIRAAVLDGIASIKRSIKRNKNSSYKSTNSSQVR